jgi:hypothetical protein
MRKWGKSSIVAAVALGCALFVMGVVRIGGGARGAAASPAPGWEPSEPEVLRQPADEAPKAPRRTDG